MRYLLEKPVERLARQTLVSREGWAGDGNGGVVGINIGGAENPKAGEISERMSETQESKP